IVHLTAATVSDVYTSKFDLLSSFAACVNADQIFNTNFISVKRFDSSVNCILAIVNSVNSSVLHNDTSDPSEKLTLAEEPVHTIIESHSTIVYVSKS
ncbi:MAG: hypothetical protein U9Q66_03585, partial [Patescibacteria group bacterium]|nr:hypothetical protein [Patescibacteria group bacterium]